MSFATEIKEEFGKTWKYFQEYIEEQFEETNEEIAFEALPFEYQLGVYVSFFNSVSTDVEMYSTDIEVLKEAVKEAFAQYEEYLFLDS